LNHNTEQAWLPDYIFQAGRFLSDTAVVCDSNGRITRLCPAAEVSHPIRLPNQALLPGLVNAHSHAFQRVIRGRTEYRSSNQDSFWTWREQMYAAALRLAPEDLYRASRMAFLEMALSGITAVGEFHYLHHSPEGRPYSDRNLLAKEVIRAATDVGLRITLLRVAYVRAGFEKEPNPQQLRFIDISPETFVESVNQLSAELRDSDLAIPGVAPHSVRAVPLDYLKIVFAYADEHHLPIHMHVAEQPAEVSECIQEHGRSPIALLDTEGLLSQRFTAVHAIHVTPKSIGSLAAAGAQICACPTTERNLGDGVVPVDAYLGTGVRVSLGTDSQIQIDLLEDARELEYHLRLQRTQRNVLAGEASTDRAGLARRLFECATVNGSLSIGWGATVLEPGSNADFFTVDLNDTSVADSSTDNLLPAIVFSMSRTAVRNVFVAGKRIVEDGAHRDAATIVEDFKALQKGLWG
jgi:formimidoylglutamate deiminase